MSDPSRDIVKGLLEKLNDNQRKLADFREGIIVVDAGPGTGKTKTITDRFVNLVTDPKINAKDIVVLTFTNAAAEEMEQRARNRIFEIFDIMCKNGDEGKGKQLLDKCSELRYGTFDSMCGKILRESPDSVSDFLGFDSHLTSSAKLVDSEDLNKRYFTALTERFLQDKGSDYGNQALLLVDKIVDTYRIINKLMSIGLVPTKDGWFSIDREGNEILVLRGNYDILEEEFKAAGTYDDNSYDIITEDRKEMFSLIHDLYYEYLRRSVEEDRLTFAIVGIFALLILYSEPGVRESIGCRYLMIDEFQDTNALQFMISMMLVKEANICAVGDWRQGIYGFRNASIDNITCFGEKMEMHSERLGERASYDVSNVNELRLDTNYRSSQPIIDASYASLKFRSSSDEKVETPSEEEEKDGLTAFKGSMDDLTHIRMVKCRDDEDEIVEVFRRIQDYVDGYCLEDGTKLQYGDIAVLCRGNSLAHKINERAAEFGIPMYFQGDIEVLNTRQAKVLLAWLRYVNNKDDTWGLPVILADLGYPMAEINAITSEKGKVPSEFTGLRVELIRKKRRITSLITSVFDRYGFDDDISQSILTLISKAHRGSLITISDIIDMIETGIENGTVYPLDPFLRTKAVTIETMHKSKGLEYPVVIVVGVDSRKFPLPNKSDSIYKYDPVIGLRCSSTIDVQKIDGEYKGTCIIDNANYEVIKKAHVPSDNEENRVFFVALSRAKQYLTVIAHNPSMFFKDMCSVLRLAEEPSLKGIPNGDNREENSISEKPVIAPYKKRRKHISAHDLMDLEHVFGGHVEMFKGEASTERGNKIHLEAERLALGYPPSKDFGYEKEREYVMKVLDSVKDAPFVKPEYECILPLNDHGLTVNGIIDLYAEYADHVEIHDYKSDTNPEMVALDEYRIQLSIYAYAAMSTGKKAICKVHYVHLGKTIEFEPVPMDVILDRASRYLNTVNDLVL